jgi:hypothetical protein
MVYSKIILYIPHIQPVQEALLALFYRLNNNVQSSALFTTVKNQEQLKHPIKVFRKLNDGQSIKRNRLKL